MCTRHSEADLYAFARPLGLILIASLCVASPAVAQRDARADRLVDGWIKAAGGANLWDRVRTLGYTITTVWYDTSGLEVRRRPRYVSIQKLRAGQRVRVERTEPAGRYVQVWDGFRAWGTLNGVVLADSSQAVREVPYVTAELVYWMGLPWKLRDPGVRLSYVDPNIVHVSFGSGVGLHDGDRYWYSWTDPRTRMPTFVEYIEQGKTENDRSRILWSEWTKFGPAVYPAKRQLFDTKGRSLRAFLISDVKVNEPLPDSLFSQP